MALDIKGKKMVLYYRYPSGLESLIITQHEP